MTARTNKTSAQSNKTSKVEDPRLVAARAAHAKKKAEAAAKAKAKAKKPVAKAAIEVADEVVPPADAKPDDIKSAWQKFIGAFDELATHPDFKAPSWQRTLCSAIAGGLVAYGVGYLGSTILNILVLGTLVLTASTFLSTLVFILGMALIIIAGAFAGMKVFDFICTGSVDKMYASAKSKVSGFFDRLGGEKEPAHA